MSKHNVTATHELVAELQRQIKNFSLEAEEAEGGRVVEVGDGIAKISGLRRVQSMEMVGFEGGAVGVALNLEEDRIGAILLSGINEVCAGESVRGLGRLLSVPVGSGMVGRVVNPLGQPIDGK